MIELLTVLVVVGLLVTLATPSMDNYMERTRTRRAMDRVVADVAYTRMLAAERGRRTALTMQANGTYSIDTLTNAGAWSPMRTVRLRDDYPGVTFSGTTLALQFSSRGILTNSGTETILKVASNETRDSIFVSPAGRVYRAF
jgi:type IV fimbrial biogenesis protein FimT